MISFSWEGREQKDNVNKLSINVIDLFNDIKWVKLSAREAWWERTEQEGERLTVWNEERGPYIQMKMCQH